MNHLAAFSNDLYDRMKYCLNKLYIDIKNLLKLIP